MMSNMPTLRSVLRVSGTILVAIGSVELLGGNFISGITKIVIGLGLYFLKDYIEERSKKE